MASRRRSDEDFAREIAAHLENEAARLIDEGMSAAEARLAARRRFGNVARAAERFHDDRRGRLLWLDHLRHDLRAAVRSMARTPVACAVAVASLAAGIGATTSTLTVRNAIFYNPPPLYGDAGQLSVVTISTPARPRARVPGDLYARWASDPALRPAIAAAAPSRPAEIRVGDRSEPVRMRAATADFFSRLGVVPAIGRAFSPAPAADGPAPLVLSHRVWLNVFDGRPDVLGTIAWIDQAPHVVAGVMPERFWFGTPESAVWTPLALTATAEQPALDVIVRRGPGVSAEALAEQLQREAAEFARTSAGENREIRILTGRVGGTGLGQQLAIVVPWLVGMAVLLTLLIACANVAILMFARWTSREREMAVRSCLGASRGRALALLLTESTLLAAAGGVLGVCATLILRGLFVRTVPDAVDYDLSIDRGILLQTAALTLLCGIVSGLAPALYETRRLLTNPLRLLAAPDRARQRWRHALVVLEIAVTVALMVVAAAQVDASRRLLTTDLGFALPSLMTARVENRTGVDVPRVLESVRRVPGVAAVAAATAVPMGMSAPSQPVSAPAGTAIVSAERVGMSPDYFKALGVPLRAGRTFSESDMTGHARVVVINETLARQLWPGRDAMTARIIVDNTPYEVIGVVAGYAGNPMTTSAPRFYLPLAPDAKVRSIQIVVRAANDPLPLVKPVREAIGRLDPGYTVPLAFTLLEVMRRGAQEMMMLGYAMSPLLGIGVFLTATGIFGVLAFAIARRAPELALRVALGASRASLARLVVVHTLRLLATGCAAGVGGTFALTRLVRAGGGGGSPFDTPGWPAFAVPVLIILTVGTLATWIPTRRAMAADPLRLIRAD